MNRKPFQLKKKPMKQGDFTQDEENDLLDMKKPQRPMVRKSNNFDDFEDSHGGSQFKPTNPMNTTKPNFKLKKPGTGSTRPTDSNQGPRGSTKNEEDDLLDMKKPSRPMMRKQSNRMMGGFGAGNQDENSLLNSKPQVSKPFKPQLRKKNPSQHKDNNEEVRTSQQRLDNPSSQFQDNSYQMSIQPQEMKPSISNKQIEKKPMMLKKNKDRKPFIPTKEPISSSINNEDELLGNNPVQNRYNKPLKKKMDEKEEIKLRQTTAKPFGPGAKVFVAKKNVNEELEKATKEVFGGTLNMDQTGKNLFQKKQQKINTQGGQLDMKQKQALLRKFQQPAPQLGSVENTSLPRSYNNQEEEESESPQKQPVGFNVNEEQKKIEVKQPVNKPRFGGQQKKKIDWEQHDKEQKEIQQKKQQMKDQLNEMMGEEGQQQYDEQGQIIANQQYIEKRDQKKEIYGDNYDYAEQDGRGINIQQTEEKYVNNSKIAKQEKRVEDLKQIIQLEVEEFDDVFELKPTTAYDIYINRIKMGTLKNSGDNCRPEQEVIEIQTEPIETDDFGNQAPDDELRTYLQKNEEDNLGQVDQAKNLLEFLGNVYPVFEEILSLQKGDQNKELEKLFDGQQKEIKFPKQLQQRLKINKVQCVCQSEQDLLTTFVSYQVVDEKESWFQISLIVEYKNFKPLRFYVSSSEIRQILFVKNILISGSKDGSLNFWDVREMDHQHKKVSNIYVSHLNSIINSNPEGVPVEEQIVFRYCSYSSEYINTENINIDFNVEEAMDNKHTSQIVDLILNTNNNSDIEIFSLEEFGKIVQWNIIELSKEETERQYIDFGNYSKIRVISPQTIDLNRLLVLHGNIITKKMAIDNDENIFVCSSAGVLKINKQGNYKTRQPKQYTELFTSTEYPTSMHTCSNTDIFIAGYSDGSIKIYSKLFAEPLFSIQNVSKKPITNIIVPEHQPGESEQNLKTIYDINKFLAVDKDSIIYSFNLVENKSGPTSKISQNSRNQDSDHVRQQFVSKNDSLCYFQKNKDYSVLVGYWKNEELKEKDYQTVVQNKQLLEYDLINYYQNLSTQVEF